MHTSLHGFHHDCADCSMYKLHPSTFVLLPAPSNVGSWRKNLESILTYDIHLHDYINTEEITNTFPLQLTRLLFVFSPVPATDTVPACAKGRLWLAGSHRVGGTQHRHVLPFVHLWKDVPWLLGQNGRQNQNLEEALVCLRPQPTHTLLLCRWGRRNCEHASLFKIISYV